MARAKVRQLWLDGVERTCVHKQPEEIRSEGGRVIAERCRACGLMLAQWGMCAGCKRERRCVYFVAARQRYGRFCTQDCYRQTVQAEKEARAEHAAKKGV